MWILWSVTLQTYLISTPYLQVFLDIHCHLKRVTAWIWIRYTASFRRPWKLRFMYPYIVIENFPMCTVVIEILSDAPTWYILYVTTTLYHQMKAFLLSLKIAFYFYVGLYFSCIFNILYIFFLRFNDGLCLLYWAGLRVYWHQQGCYFRHYIWRSPTNHFFDLQFITFMWI